MTLRELLDLAGGQTTILLILFGGMPVLALLLGLMHGKDRGGLVPWSWTYALIVYAVCVPGMCAAVVLGYALFFTNENLLDVNALVYILPVASMGLTLALVGRNVRFEQIPGFGRLGGLMIILGLSFGMVLALHKTRIWLVFGGGMGNLLLALLGAFILFKVGAHMLFKRKD